MKEKNIGMSIAFALNDCNFLLLRSLANANEKQVFASAPEGYEFGNIKDLEELEDFLVDKHKEFDLVYALGENGPGEQNGQYAYDLRGKIQRYGLDLPGLHYTPRNLFLVKRKNTSNNIEYQKRA